MTHLEPAEMVRGKRVALIGRAASILEHGDGKRIDTFDLVIRVNWLLPLEGDADRIGTRTDVLIHPFTSRAIPENARANGVVAWRKDDPLGYELSAAHGFPGVNPRTGVTAVAMIANAGALSMYLTGYDFYASASATRTLPEPNPLKGMPGRKGGHSTELDRIILRALVEQHGCEVDEVLARALATEVTT